MEAETREKEWLKVPEVAELLGIPRSRMYDLIARGKIPGVVRLGPKSIRVNRPILEQKLLKDHGIAS